jgi:alpha-galactosidase
MITNKLAISINQDPTEQGKRIKTDGKTEVWAKKTKDGNTAVLLLNRSSDNSKNVSISPLELGIAGKVNAVDVYTGKSLGKISKSITHNLAPHSSLFLLVNSK